MSTHETGKHDRRWTLGCRPCRRGSYAEAGKAAAVSKATLARRMREPAFRGQVVEAREEILDQVRGALTDAAPKAASALTVLAAGARSESVRLQASTRLIDLVLRRRPGLDTLTSEEATAIVREMMELALARLPEDQHEPYLREVRGIATRC